MGLEVWGLGDEGFGVRGLGLWFGAWACVGKSTWLCRLKFTGAIGCRRYRDKFFGSFGLRAYGLGCRASGVNMS